MGGGGQKGGRRGGGGGAGVEDRISANCESCSIRRGYFWSREPRGKVSNLDARVFSDVRFDGLWFDGSDEKHGDPHR